jgi:hypothetical protein
LLFKRGYRARNLNEGQYQFLEKYQFEDNASLSKFTSVSDIRNNEKAMKVWLKLYHVTRG